MSTPTGDNRSSNGHQGWPSDSDPLSRVFEIIENRIAPALDRIADSLERLASMPHTVSRAGPDLGDEPSSNKQTAADESPEARESRIIDRKQRLDSAKAVNDAGAALGFRDELASLLDPAEMATIDRTLARWLMSLLMKRMRTGTVQSDVAILAARAAESLGHLPEGASLHAALPTLRRCAGLCPRCARPFLGVENACPECLAGTPKIADLPSSSGVAT